MNITPDERDRAIEAILTKGLTRPVPIWAFLRDMWRNLGPKLIFWDLAPAVLVSCVVLLGYITLILLQLSRLETAWNVYAMLFLFSPILFISLTVCTEAIERLGGIYEIKMTSKYTIRQITTFRLLSFALAGTVFTVLGSIFLSSAWEALQFVQLFSLALSSLFLCSLLTIYTMRRLRGGWYIGAIIWTAIGVLPVLLFRENWDSFLSSLPPAVTLGVAVIACVFFLREIRINTKGVLIYAYR
jgi:hypothetical protein